MPDSEALQQDVLTIDEVSSFLRVSKDALQAEIASGRLPAIIIAGEVRILKTDFLEFLEAAKAHRNSAPHASGHAAAAAARVVDFDLNVSGAEPFRHVWPNRKEEEYKEAYSGTVRVGSETRQVQIGFANRNTAGKVRPRAVVFIDRRPLVEFTAADDFDHSKNMVSLIKRKTGKQIRPGEAIPGEYRHLSVEPYRKYVTGPYASSNLAIVCSATNLKAMVEHALIRLRNIAKK